MAIENINNGESMRNVREQKLNELIAKMNALEQIIPQIQTQVGNLDADKQVKISTNLLADIMALNTSPASVYMDKLFWRKETNDAFQENMSLPIASENNAGFITAAMVKAITDVMSDVASLKGANKRVPTNEALLKTLSQEELQAIWDAATNSKPVVDGDSLISFNEETPNVLYSYFGSLGQWKYRGLDAISIATLATLGAVKGSLVNGQIYVEADGTMSLVGWDWLIETLGVLFNNISWLVDEKANRAFDVDYIRDGIDAPDMPFGDYYYNTYVKVILEDNAFGERRIEINQATPNITINAQFDNQSGRDIALVFQKTRRHFANTYLVGNADNVDTINGNVVVVVPADHIIEISYITTIENDVWECSITNNIPQIRV